MTTQLTITLDFQRLGRWLLGSLFIWAALSKLAQPTEFLGAMYAYQLPLPKSFLQLVAVVLPWFELLCGVLLLRNQSTESVLLAAAVLLGVFLVCTGQAWTRGLHISCGCFNLRMLGLDRGHPLVELLDSTGFAFLRNLLLGTLTVQLARKRLNEVTAVLVPGKPGAASKKLDPARAAA